MSQESKRKGMIPCCHKREWNIKYIHFIIPDIFYTQHKFYTQQLVGNKRKFRTKLPQDKKKAQITTAEQNLHITLSVKLRTECKITHTV